MKLSLKISKYLNKYLICLFIGGKLMDAAQRIALIFEVLESGKSLTLTNLAKRTKMHYWTIQKYIDLIIDIQKRPQLEKIESESTVVLVRLKKD